MDDTWKLEISAAEVMVIIDTLAGSLHIADNGTIFKYDGENRNRVREHLLGHMNHSQFKLTIQENNEG